MFRAFWGCVLLGIAGFAAPGARAAEGAPPAAPDTLTVPALPVASWKVGDWARYEGRRLSGRMEPLDFDIRLEVVEKTDAYVVVDRRLVNLSAKTMPEEAKTIWNSTEESSDRLQFDLAGTYTAIALFTDPDSEPIPGTDNQRPRSDDLSAATGVKKTAASLEIHGETVESARYVFKLPLKVPAPPEDRRREIPRFSPTHTEWRHENEPAVMPFGLLRGRCEMAGAVFYDMTFVEGAIAGGNPVPDATTENAAQNGRR